MTLSQPVQLVPCDVTSDAEIDALYTAVEAEHGGLDFLVHGVAFASREALSEPFVQTTRQEWIIRKWWAGTDDGNGGSASASASQGYAIGLREISHPDVENCSHCSHDRPPTSRSFGPGM